MELPTRRSTRMITSVSILPRMIGAAMAVSLLNCFGILSSTPHGSDVGDRPRNRRSSGARRARQMSPRARPLPSDEIAVRGRDRTLAGCDGLAVGREAHRAAGLAPFESGLGEDLVEPFGDRVAFDVLRARHHPGA